MTSAPGTIEPEADEPDSPERTGLSWVQVSAGALAAVSSAVLLSTLGVAGTIIGAAVGSVSASVGSALYGRWIDASRRRAAALARIAAARTRGAPVPVPEQPSPASVAWHTVPWKRVATVATCLFLAAMLAITAYERLTGEALSAQTGGTGEGRSSTIPGLGRGDREDPGDDRPEESPTPTDSTTDPTPTPTRSPTATTGGSPSPEQTPSPTASPTAEPEPTGTPLPTATAATSAPELP